MHGVHVTPSLLFMTLLVGQRLKKKKRSSIRFSIPCVFECPKDEKRVCGLIPAGRCVTDAALIGQQCEEDLHWCFIR